MLDQLGTDIWQWAWARHQNLWSWYIRPLFLLPYVWFAWRRSPAGILLTLVALLTSMAWFPAPEVPDPRAAAFLEMEKRFLTSDWTLVKLAQVALVPATMAALAAAFWRRSPGWGLAVINFIAVAKTAWSVASENTAGWAVAAPALVGLAICNVGVVFAWRRWRRKSRVQTVGNAPPS